EVEATAFGDGRRVARGAGETVPRDLEHAILAKVVVVLDHDDRLGRTADELIRTADSGVHVSIVDVDARVVLRTEAATIGRRVVDDVGQRLRGDRGEGLARRLDEDIGLIVVEG